MKPDKSELKEALLFIKDRFNQSLVNKLEKGNFSENLLKYLRERKNTGLLFSSKKLATIAKLARKYDPEEASWEKENHSYIF